MRHWRDRLTRRVIHHLWLPSDLRRFSIRPTELLVQHVVHHYAFRLIVQTCRLSRNAPTFRRSNELILWQSVPNLLSVHSWPFAIHWMPRPAISWESVCFFVRVFRTVLPSF